MGCGSSKMKAAFEKAGDEIVVAVAQAGAEITKEVVVAAKDIAVEAVKEGKEIATEAIKEGDKVFKEKMEEIRDDLRDKYDEGGHESSANELNEKYKQQDETIYHDENTVMFIDKDGKQKLIVGAEQEAAKESKPEPLPRPDY